MAEGCCAGLPSVTGLSGPGFVALVAVVEVSWVPLSSFELTCAQVGQAIEALLQTKEIIVGRADQVLKALRLFMEGTAHFADCLIERISHSAGGDRTMTFDVGAARAARMTPTT
jgi:predicted nucleic-acid-binding protein